MSLELGLSTFPSYASTRGGSSDANGSARAKSPEQSDQPTQPGATSATGEALTKEQQAKVRELKARDAEVKAHEQAHAAVGGSYASAPNYTYTQGPDGKRYAVGGEVQIDTSPERTPEATIRKMDIVISAALAPAEPSSQDQAVARQAQQQRLDAQQQLAAQQAEERSVAASEGPESQANASGLDATVLTQIIAQEAGDTPQSTDASATAAAAYQSAASLTEQIFGAAS